MLSGMLASVYSRAPFGMQAPPITINVHLGPGLPTLLVVGLAGAAVKESKDRVRSAIQLAGFEWPPGRITVKVPGSLAQPQIYERSRLVAGPAASPVVRAATLSG